MTWTVGETVKKSPQIDATRQCSCSIRLWCYRVMTFVTNRQQLDNIFGNQKKYLTEEEFLRSKGNQRLTSQQKTVNLNPHLQRFTASGKFSVQKGQGWKKYWRVLLVLGQRCISRYDEITARVQEHSSPQSTSKISAMQRRSQKHKAHLKWTEVTWETDLCPDLWPIKSIWNIMIPIRQKWDNTPLLHFWGAAQFHMFSVFFCEKIWV